MEAIDRKKERTVWQRVTAPPAARQNREDLQLLYTLAAEKAARCRNLPAMLTGRQREAAQQLEQQAAANAACLRGMLRLEGGDGRYPERNLPREPASQALTRLYHQSRRTVAEYTARSVDAEFGVVFQEMAERERRLCAGIAQLLGELPQRDGKGSREGNKILR